MRDDRMRVLLIDKDADVTDVVLAILTDEGYSVATLSESDHASVASAVGIEEPDCVLLDNGGGPEFGDSWEEAAYLAARERRIPTVMFTASSQAVREAREGQSARATRAGFAAIVEKPFRLDDLLEAVARACGQSDRFDRTKAGDRQRNAELVRRLKAAGATDIRTSNRREWATFVSPHDGQIYQLYWWQRLGLYIIGRYGEDARLGIIGRFFELDAGIAAALHPDG